MTSWEPVSFSRRSLLHGVSNNPEDSKPKIGIFVNFVKNFTEDLEKIFNKVCQCKRILDNKLKGSLWRKGVTTQEKYDHLFIIARSSNDIIFKKWHLSFRHFSVLGKFPSFLNSKLRTALFWVITQRVVVITYRRFGTTYQSHLQWSKISLSVKMGRISHPELSARNCHYCLRNSPQDLSVHLPRDGSLKSVLTSAKVDMRDIIMGIILKTEYHFICYSALHGPQKWYRVIHRKMTRSVKEDEKLLWSW